MIWPSTVMRITSDKPLYLFTMVGMLHNWYSVQAKISHTTFDLYIYSPS